MRGKAGLLLVISCLLIGTDCQQSSTVRPNPPSTRNPADATPAWSPDGSMIAFGHYQQPGNDSMATGLYVLELATHRRRFLASGRIVGTSWFSDSKHIAFSIGPICTIGLTDSIPTQVVSGTNYYPCVSVGDTAIVFDTPTNDAYGESVIWVTNLVTQSTRDISVHLTGEWRHAQWSPDGRWIVHYRFGYSNNGTTELFKMDPNGQSPIRLTNDNVDDTDPCWDPTNKLIAWSRGAYFDREIWVANTDGSNPHKVRRGVEPAFSPDGKRLVFVDPSSSDGIDLHIMNVDGTGYTPL